MGFFFHSFIHSFRFFTSFCVPAKSIMQKHGAQEISMIIKCFVNANRNSTIVMKYHIIHATDGFEQIPMTIGKIVVHECAPFIWLTEEHTIFGIGRSVSHHLAVRQSI